MDSVAFRQHFPEFADTTKYTVAQVDFYGAIAEQEIHATRFGGVRSYAVELLAAHRLALASLNAIGSAGVGGGLLTSKRVGDVGYGYDVSGVTGGAGAAYSGTRYGVLLSEMLRTYGAGVVQL
jgi:hypothetical protein